LHKVIENDIVLSEIDSAAREVGFDGLQVCLSPLLPMLIQYEEYKTFPTNTTLVNNFVQATDWRVKNYPIFFLKKRGIATLDSRGTRALRSRLERISPSSIVCNAGETIEIQLRATNTGDAIWLPSGARPGTVNIGVIVTGEDGSSSHYRSHLSYVTVVPGMHVDAVVLIPGLDKGTYNVELDLVAEHIAWFRTLGNREVNIRLKVT